MIGMDIIDTVSMWTDTIGVDLIFTECQLAEDRMNRIITTEILDLVIAASREMVCNVLSKVWT